MRLRCLLKYRCTLKTCQTVDSASLRLTAKRFCQNPSSDAPHMTNKSTSCKPVLLLNDVLSSNNPELIKRLHPDQVNVISDFITDAEEDSLMSEISPYMSRLRYEYDHWDNAIHGYRETERSKWNEDNKKVISRIKNAAFTDPKNTMSLVHVLDLAENGYIKPHVDSVRFCGDTIAGVSLLSDAVMKLVSTENPSIQIDLLLKRKSLYILRNDGRFKFTHEILPNDMSSFMDHPIKKGRRVSIICRNEPRGDEH